MNELTQCIELVIQMMGKSVAAQLDARGFCEQVRARVTRLFEEGLDMKTIVDLLIERQHEKENSDHGAHLDQGDFSVIEKKIGLNDPTPENRTRWGTNFSDGRARHLCPQCGYAGNSEFRDCKSLGLADYIQCPLCYCFEYRQFFTRDWTPDEQATFEKERTATRKAQAEKRIAQAEREQRQKKMLDELRSEAVKAVKIIDELQWSLMGESPDDYLWDEELVKHEIRRVMELIVRPTFEGALPVPWDDVVAFFKANLRPSEDAETAAQEFDRCAKDFNMAMLKAVTGGDCD
jgi:hypothetical protein